MAGMNVECINPFLEAAIAIVRDACQLELTVGKPYAKKVEFEQDSVVIMIGVTGEMRGQVILTIDVNKACSIASMMMMGMPVNELDDMALSAISELGNMIMGNAATLLSTRGIGIDITPPSVGRGNGTIDTVYTKNLAIPMTHDGDVFLEINIAIKQE